MKKRLSYLLTFGIAVLIIGGVFFFYTTTDNANSDQATFKPTIACDTLTLAEARSVMGSTTQKLASSPPTIKNNIETSTCTYQTDLVLARVTVRSPLNGQGLESIDDSFHGRMNNYTRVTGYGHHAYYDEANAQLNVHDDGNWYIITWRNRHEASQIRYFDLVPLADKVFN